MDITLSKDLIVSNATSAEKATLEKHMSFTNPAWQDAVKFKRSTYGIKQVIKLYERDGKVLRLPRGSLYKVIGLVGYPKSLIDETARFDKVEVTSRIKLRNLQKPWVESLLSHRQGIGVAPAGSGKTIMALQAIVNLGQPTLWLTHRQTLVNQFKERVGFFIGAGHVGTIGGGKYDFGDFITVGMVQTLARRDVESLSKMFGVVVVDECHVVPAMQTLKTVRKFAPHYLYGVTATPYREDRLEQIMFDTIGPTIAAMDRDKVVEAKGILPASVKVVDTGVTYNSFGPPEFSKIIEYLANHEGRNRLIAADVLTEIALGNICIVLTNRIEHGKILRDLLVAHGVDCAHLHSKQSKKEREKGLERFISGEIPLIIATYQLLSDGFDHQPTSRIFFALPYKAKGLIEQSKGRIERSLPGKDDAIVYDYVDRIPMLQRQFAQRCEQYQEHNLEINFPK